MNPGQENIVVYVLMALTGMLTAAVGAMVYLLRRRDTEKHGQPPHKTFADDPRGYWLEMKEVVTEPLAKVLSEVASVLRELRDQAIKENAAREERERLERRERHG